VSKLSNFAQALEDGPPDFLPAEFWGSVATRRILDAGSGENGCTAIAALFAFFPRTRPQLKTEIKKSHIVPHPMLLRARSGLQPVVVAGGQPKGKGRELIFNCRRPMCGAPESYQHLPYSANFANRLGARKARA